MKSEPTEDSIDDLQKDDIYDPKSSRENPRWICRAVRFVEKFPTIVSLAIVRSIPELANMKILQK